jgi:hypothetical protein
VKKFSIALLLVIMAFVIIPAAQAQSVSVDGAWEMTKNGVVWIISFVEDTFVIYKNGKMFQYGIYTVTPAAWGVTVTSNHPRNLYMEYGAAERARQGFTYDISANELVLSDKGWRSIQGSGHLQEFPLGTYKRGKEPSESRNPLVGVWRCNYIDEEGEAATDIFRFFPNGKGVLIFFPYKYPLRASLYKVTYELGTKPGTGQISLLGMDTTPEHWGEEFVMGVSPFVIDGNILRFEGDPDEYRKK